MLWVPYLYVDAANVVTFADVGCCFDCVCVCPQPVRRFANDDGGVAVEEGSGPIQVNIGKWRGDFPVAQCELQLHLQAHAVALHVSGRAGETKPARAVAIG